MVKVQLKGAFGPPFRFKWCFWAPGAPGLGNIRKYNGSGGASGVPEPQNGVFGCHLMISMISTKMIEIPLKSAFAPPLPVLAPRMPPQNHCVSLCFQGLARRGPKSTI